MVGGSGRAIMTVVGRTMPTFQRSIMMLIQVGGSTTGITNGTDTDGTMSESPTDGSNRIGIPGAATGIGSGKDTGESRGIDPYRQNSDRTSETGDGNNTVKDPRFSDMSNRDGRK